MTHKLIKKIITLGLLVLIIPLFSLPVNAETWNPINNTITTQGSGIYVEDFETTLYRNGPNTDAEGWGWGSITNDKNLSMIDLDFEATTNPVRAIDVQGRKVYAVQYDPSATTESLNVYSINDPTNIYRTGFRSSQYEHQSIAVAGDYVFTGSGLYDYLSSYNYQDPFSTGIWYGNYANDGDPTDIEINGYFVYYTVFNSISGYSLRVLNAEDPTLYNNVIPASWSDSSMAKGLAVDGDTAYVAAHTDGFYIVDVSNQYSFSTIGWCDTPGNATDVVVDGNYAYVTDGYEGVQVIDISNPVIPVLVASYNTIDYAQKLVLQGNTLFIADGFGGIAMADVANPEHPVFVPPWFMLPYTYDIDLYGGYIVIGTEAGIHTFACGAGITKIQNEVCANPFDQFNVTDVRVKGDIAICVGGSDGIFTLDVSDPNNPVLLDQHVEAAPANYRKLDVQGNFAYVADYGAGIRVYDITDPTNVIHADMGGLSYATDVALYGDMAFVADGTYGVYNYNITDPYNIVYQSSFVDIFTNVTAVDVEGAKLYVVDDNNGAVQASFFVFDISDVDNEVQLGSQSLNAEFYDVFVDGDVAYTSDTTWMLPYNISDPTTPVWTTWTTAESYGVWGFGPYALSAGRSFGVTLYDCTNIVYGFDPVNVNYPDATGAMQITTYGDYTYIANSSNLLILRHFESLADTYVDGFSAAQSLEVDTTDYIIYNATLSADDYHPPGTVLYYYMSADGGANWDFVTPGYLHTFTHPGNDLRFHIFFDGPKDRSAHVYEVNIEYFYNVEPDAPIMNQLGTITNADEVTASWFEVIDDFGTDIYQLEFSTDGTFSTIAGTVNTTFLSHKITGLADGMYYFRVRAIDIYGLVSPWSNMVNTTIDVPALQWWAYVAIGGGVVVLAAIVVTVVVVSKKRKIVTR